MMIIETGDYQLLGRERCHCDKYRISNLNQLEHTKLKLSREYLMDFDMRFHIFFPEINENKIQTLN